MVITGARLASWPLDMGAGAERSFGAAIRLPWKANLTPSSKAT
jgi:hypothetical protein